MSLSSSVSYLICSASVSAMTADKALGQCPLLAVVFDPPLLFQLDQV